MTPNEWPIDRILAWAGQKRPRLATILARPSPPLWLGIIVATALIAAETVLVQLLGHIGPRMTFGAVYLLGVLVISFAWGIGLAVATTLVSAVVYLEIHLVPGDGLLPDELPNLVALAVFVPIALLANVLGAQARLRAIEAQRAADRVSELARRQAALRRIATLVAQGVSPNEIFAAVADEVANALEVGNATLFRYLDSDMGEIVAAHTEGPTRMPIGARLPLAGDNIAALVQRTGAVARMNTHEGAAGSLAELIRDLGLVSGVGAPIVVDGRLWGAAIVGFSRPEPPRADTEERLTDFAELVATAVANAEAHGELIASRARIVAAGDEARRRIERDLHDGAQQRLVALGLQIRSLQASLPPGSDVVNQLGAVSDGLVAASDELRQISHGIHPAVLSHGGLRPALRALRRSSVTPVELSVDVGQRLPESVEVAAYYVVAEALTNAAKHACASQVTVTVDTDDQQLRLSVADDGVGGATLGRGSGLIGLKDRVEALGGHLDISSPDHAGTTLSAQIPYTTVRR
ncbi:GAF domain-containing protein [Mycobacterium sp. DL99]|uniref:sensor histidine kinase n=1 Tax=Mycobacterium sp. DL99 TaxID=2528957 RepID=UPI001081BD7C|nr:GAF domain-containing protein [Mycobacterium sp. DL99]